MKRFEEEGSIFSRLNSVLMHNELGYITFVFFAVMSLVGSFALWMFARVVDRENRDGSDGELKSLLEKDGGGDGKKKKKKDNALKLALF